MCEGCKAAHVVMCEGCKAAHVVMCEGCKASLHDQPYHPHT
jgi:hypothetical protein